ncbi:hypothetical protein P175DRAFT_0447332 [Aspergillus ochraceoroseus IBT 24754]|uniref:Zn(2)-C6 fungal-type domain-containing protein n=1 Tax=Aspergillus ochraceoroseus IBT 24754 TaxID=1392256 RepID=A0A2T5LKT9_9EURO|nr:uncharacterized protein P175DRAFT_0447332 [Aspergillus ochraceoroseus IBT 24754]PTU16904.1 hypothetical protein P175DRAFT_0447332 [Aspergillus ochraceoroseus IBT 24754]
MTKHKSIGTPEHGNLDHEVRRRCDGANPCSRCKTHNTICFFGKKTKPHYQMYPQGYVNRLEQQEQYLVCGLRILYRQACNCGAWPGEPLKCELNGHPLTHDMLTRLGALDYDKNAVLDKSEDTMLQECRKNKGHTQLPVFSNSSPNSVQSLALSLHFSDPSQRQIPAKLSAISDTLPAQSPRALINAEISSNPHEILTPASMEEVICACPVQDPPDWMAFGSIPSDRMDTPAAAQQTDLYFDFETCPTMLNYQLPTDGIELPDNPDSFDLLCG